MNIDKYNTVCGRNLDLATAIRWTVGPPAFNSSSRDENVVAAYVRNTLKHIIVRPISQLDLGQGHRETIENGLMVTTSFIVFGQVVGYDAGPCNRITYVDKPEAPRPSILPKPEPGLYPCPSYYDEEAPRPQYTTIHQVIEYLVGWHASCADFSDKPLALNCVTMSTKKNANFGYGDIVEQTLDIYRGSRNFFSDFTAAAQAITA